MEGCRDKLNKFCFGEGKESGEGRAPDLEKSDGEGLAVGAWNMRTMSAEASVVHGRLRMSPSATKIEEMISAKAR